MKTPLRSALVVLILASLFSASDVCAAPSEGGFAYHGIEWTFEEGGKIGYSHSNYVTPAVPTNTKGDIVVPTEYQEEIFWGVSDGAFAGCSLLTSIAFPATIETFGSGVFEGCTSLERVLLPDRFDGVDIGLPDGVEAEYYDPSEVVVASSALPDATEDTAYAAWLEAVGGTAPYTWSVDVSAYAETTAASTFSESGEAQGWQEDDGCWTLELPFAFPFFGSSYATAKVSSNGTISFGDDDFGGYSYDEDAFLARPMIAVMWKDLDTGGGDIYVASSSESATISWRCAYLDGGAVNMSTTLHSDGRIVLSYGSGNADGGFIGISAGDGETMVVSPFSEAGSMDGADDVVFAPARLPDGISLAADGTLSGTPSEPGPYPFVAVVTDDDGATASKSLTLTVSENPALRPTIVSASPEPGYANIAGDAPVAFSVSATHPDGGAVSYAWTVDGEDAGTGATFAGIEPDDSLHTIRCVVSGEGLPKTKTVEWRAGVLEVSDPESTSVSYGQRATLSVSATSPLAATVTWFDAATDDEVGTGETLTLRNATETASYYAVAENELGSARSAAATVTVDPAPAVGRIYKMTGPAFVGNRLVLRAKVYGDPTGATFAWKRDGVTVATTERLDIASLSASDFGTYTLTATTPYGTATSEEYVLEEARSGVPFGWGASGHGRTTAPEGITGLAQVASGMNFNLGLKTDGTVAAWGYDGHGGCDVPDGLSGVSSVAAGGYESQGAGFAVRTDGSVVAWGAPHDVDGDWDERWVDTSYEGWVDTSYEDDDGNWIEDGYWGWIYDGYYEDYWREYTNGWDTVSLMPAGLSDVVQVAVGGEFALALKADGTVVSWGTTRTEEVWNDESGEYETLTRSDYGVPEDLDDVVAVAAGGRRAFALRADGTIAAWGSEYDDALDVPSDLADAVAVCANKDQWDGNGIALDSDGSLSAWGSPWTGLTDVPAAAGFVAVDAGQRHAMALDGDGNVSVWGDNGYEQNEVPEVVQGSTFAIAAGGYHCTALLTDTDGDTISDAEEILLGRDPNVWEDWRRASLSGTVTVDGGSPVANALVCVYDASGRMLDFAWTDENGFYEVEGLVPANYFVSVEAEGAADAWAGDALPPVDGIEDTLAPGVPWTSGSSAPVAVGGSAPACDFELAPGQLAAWARVEADKWTIESEDDDWEEVALPEGTKVYLDMWPVGTDDDLAFDLGEVAKGVSPLDGLVLLPHAVTVRRPEPDAQIPSPDLWITGEEGRVVAATPSFSGETGAVTIVTDPAGAEVWIDYADESLGVTPLTVDNLAAGASHCHVLLLRKEGCLRPRPVEFELAIGEENEISIPLAADTEPAMGVAVSSGIPGLPIYLDYLPTEQITPATVGGMDPASHAGDLWHSASHSILLRDARLRPFAPRAVPEPEIDAETGDPVPGDWAEILVVAPSSYDDSDGDGIRNDIEVAGGTDPFDETDGDYTETTPVPVPHRWLDGYPGLLAAHGGDYEEAALADEDGDGHETWREFVAGTDPTDRESVFRATISFVDGVPDVRWEPDLPGTRRYTVEASSALGQGFAPTTDVDNGGDVRFYRVKVQLR